MSGAALLPVAEALARVLATAPRPLEGESVPLAQAAGRTLAADLAALRTQPPADLSAMDGYAARAVDVSALPARLKIIGESAAGRGFAGALGAGQAVRIFTGARLPEGADTVIIQENTVRDGDAVLVREGVAAPGRNIRRAGLDFSAGDIGLTKGTRLTARHIGLAAAMGHAVVPVTRRPRVGVLATGDELVLPGGVTGPDQIIASNSFAVAALVTEAGGEPIDLGIARDTLADLARCIGAAQAARADILITLGGASVGDHDLVQKALALAGMDLGFWRIAMRPGKPLMHGRIGAMRVLGLPGNPVSSIVCAMLFAAPLIRALCGDPDAARDKAETAVLAADMPENDNRQDYVRATLAAGSGLAHVTPLPRQDSSMLRALSAADCLIIRPPFAPAAQAGEACRVVRL